MDFLDRFHIMLNEKQIKRKANAQIIVFGVGGVGSALCHFLVRSGIYNLDIVDYDTIDITNVNRQLVANRTNIGKLKVEELKNQLLNINPKLNINIYPIKYSQQTALEINLLKYDYICDCIDDVSAKKLLILNAKELNKKIICAMGAGNRYSESPQFEIADIFKTSYDPLAKIIRKFCADSGIKKLTVCYTKQKAQKIDCKKIGSVVYYPIDMACKMCAKVINDIMEEA